MSVTITVENGRRRHQKKKEKISNRFRRRVHFLREPIRPANHEFRRDFVLLYSGRVRKLLSHVCKIESLRVLMVHGSGTLYHPEVATTAGRVEALRR